MLTEHKDLGKIGKVRFGVGGYDDAMFGFSFVLHGNTGSAQDFWGQWQHRDEKAKGTEVSREQYFGSMCIRIMNLMKQAKVKDIYKLEGIPIEIVWSNGRLKDWRILTEVL